MPADAGIGSGSDPNNNGEHYIILSANAYREGAYTFVKAEINVRPMPIDEFESGEYTPARSACLQK